MLAELRALAERNDVYTSLIGLGYHDTITPLVILRNVLENPAWYTAYTPYQPEISQGRLEALLNFQTMVARPHRRWISPTRRCSTKAPPRPRRWRCSTASTRRRGTTFFVDADCHPQTIAVVRTRAEPLGINVVVGDPAVDVPADGVFGVLLQYPGSSGALRDPGAIVDAAHGQGALVACRGRPARAHAGDAAGRAGRRRRGRQFAALRCAARFRWSARRVPRDARRVQANDARPDRRCLDRPRGPHGVSGSALQTREQHIRREKATSNICTAQVLLAVIAGLYASYHGPEGLRAIAMRVHRLAARLAASLRAGGVEVVHEAFFDTITVRVPGRAGEIAAAARSRRINLRVVDADTLGDRVRRDDDRRDARRGVRVVRRRRGRRCRRRCRCRADAIPGSLAPHVGVPDASRRSTSTGPSTRCCATCAGSPTATSRSTAR